MQKLEVFGNAPSARFGHTMAYVSKERIILFGGAQGDTGKYTITGDVYSFDMLTNVWRKIESTPAH